MASSLPPAAPPPPDPTPPFDPTPGPEPRRRIMTQRWMRVTFLHWPYDPSVVAPLLPAGTAPDLYDGVTWIGLIAFAMRDVSLFGAPAVPYLSNFLETNVRAYAIDSRGRRSVVFLTLDASRALPVAVARTSYRLPYIWSSMRMRRTGEEIVYRTRRRLSGLTSRIRIRVGPPATARPLDDFLTARWGLHSRWFQRTSYVPITHRPWPLRAAELLDLDDELVEAAGLPAPVGDPQVVFSDGVEVHVGWPQSMST